MSDELQFVVVLGEMPLLGERSDADKLKFVEPGEPLVLITATAEKVTR